MRKGGFALIFFVWAFIIPSFVAALQAKVTANLLHGPQCCKNSPILNPNSGAGHVEVIGYEAPNLRKLTDKVAAAGYFVVVPDFFHGDPYNPQNPEKPVQVWLKDHGTEKGYEEAKPVIESLKRRGICKIGAAGFCWGGKVAVQLAQGDEYIQASVRLHPATVNVDDIKGMKVPISILGAELDQSSPPELMKQFEEALNAKPEVDSYVKIFPGVAHGWTLRYNPEDAAAVKSAEEAHQDMLSWFQKYIN